MSDTPRTDAVAHGCFENDKSDYDAYAEMLNHARQLERERDEARAEVDRLREKLDLVPISWDT